MSDEPLLQVEDLCVRYGERLACRDVSLALWPGEVVAIVGEIGFRQDDAAQCHMRPGQGASGLGAVSRC